MNLLLIDDEKEFCSLMTDFFTRKGYSVASSYNGKEGLAEFDSFKPDIVLLDIKMPVLGGIETLEKIKENSNIPVIIVSGSASKERQENCLALGAYAFITKPISLDDIIDKVRSALESA